MFIEKLALFKVNIVYDIPRLDLDVQPVDSKMQHRAAGTLSNIMREWGWPRWQRDVWPEQATLSLISLDLSYKHTPSWLYNTSPTL